MRGQSGIIALTLCALLVGGCAAPSEMMRGNGDNRYENTDRPIIPHENANRPIMALEFGAGKYAAVRSGSVPL
jgi:PBP1b-binding outer membrane lipoprotein LpoB